MSPGIRVRTRFGPTVREPTAAQYEKESTMKMHVDFDLCEGHGECVAAAPEIFDLDDAGEKVVLLMPDPGEELREKAVEAVKICPIAALRLEG